MGFHAVTRPSTREDLSIEDQLATNVGLILTKSQRQADFFSSGPGYGQTGTGFWNPKPCAWVLDGNMSAHKKFNSKVKISG